MTVRYRLHYAPDNASLIVRLALLEMGQPFATVLVDRAKQEQRSPAYLELNPNGLIPVLETPHGPLFETGAILFWLSETHDRMAPARDAPDRGAFLKWFFFTSNTLHTELRMLFRPQPYVGTDPGACRALRRHVTARLSDQLAMLDRLAATCPVLLDPDTPSVLCYYWACLMRWMALYPRDDDRSWYDPARTPALLRMISALEERPAVQAARIAEGLGPHPFSAPVLATPPEGSPT